METRREQGVNRVVMLVRDLDAGRAFYEKLLGCTFHSVNDEEAAAFGVRTVFSWDGGIELVAPLEGKESHLTKILEERGEGLIGVVWAVRDADASKAAGADLGVTSYFSLDYDQAQEDLRRMTGIDLDSSTIHREARRQGELATALRDADVALSKTLEGVGELAARACTPSTCLHSISCFFSMSTFPVNVRLLDGS